MAENNNRELREPKKCSLELFYNEAVDLLSELNNEELGTVMRAAFIYDMYGEDTVIEDRAVRGMYNGLKRRLDAGLKKYRDKCDNARDNANSRWDKENGITSWEDGYPQFVSIEARDAYIKKHGEPPYKR